MTQIISRAVYPGSELATSKWIKDNPIAIGIEGSKRKYHKNDDSTMAHLHLDLLAYWLVNTILYQLKRSVIHGDWKEIKRKTSTLEICIDNRSKRLR